MQGLWGAGAAGTCAPGSHVVNTAAEGCSTGAHGTQASKQAAGRRPHLDRQQASQLLHSHARTQAAQHAARPAARGSQGRQVRQGVHKGGRCGKLSTAAAGVHAAVLLCRFGAWPTCSQPSAYQAAPSLAHQKRWLAAKDSPV